MSDLEFAEVSQIDLRMEVKNQFPFRFADGNRWAVSKSWDGEAVIFELSCKSNADQPFHLAIDEIGPSKRKTVFDKKDACQIKSIYNTSPILERQILMLDPVYANILSNDPEPQHMVSISLPPSDPNHKFSCPVAIVTSSGVCEVRVRRDNIRRYDHVLVDVSELWKNCCTLRHPHNFDTITSLTDYYTHLVFTAVCFRNAPAANARWVLFCATRSGMVLSFEIADSQADIKYITKTDLGPINLLKYFCCGAAGSEREFVFAASTSGQLKVYLKNRKSELLETDTLWGVKDKMTLHGFETRFSEESNQIVVATSKSSHFLIFFISLEGRLLKKLAYYVGLITGLEYYEGNQYIICTLNGHTTQLTVSCVSDEIQIQLEDIKNDLDSKTYEVLGMATTTNKVAWIFLQFPVKLFEHSFRNPTMLSVCGFNMKKPLTIMEADDSKKLYEFADCIEIVRCTFIKFGPSDACVSFNHEKAEIDDGFVRKLKILATVLHAKLCSFRKRVRNDDAKQTEANIVDIRNVIETYQAYKRLQRLATLKKLTKAQKLSGAYFRNKLFDFSRDCSNVQWLMANVESHFANAVADLMKRTEHIVPDELENCVFCDETVDMSTGMCSNEHSVSRCCISFLQIQLFGARACENCAYAAIDDDNLLKQVMHHGETISCPLCDGPLTNAKSLIYLK